MKAQLQNQERYTVNLNQKVADMSAESQFLSAKLEDKIAKITTLAEECKTLRGQLDVAESRASRLQAANETLQDQVATFEEAGQELLGYRGMPLSQSLT